jgi:HSP20 family protein
MADKRMAEKKDKDKEKDKQGRLPSRWDPFAELEAWRPFGERMWSPRAFARMMEEFFEGWPAAPRHMWPAIDVSEDNDRYTVSVELPGARRDDVTVELTEGAITIRGEKRSEREERKEHARYTERRFGSFSRSFTLPRDADPDRIEASFNEGILTLTIGKREEGKPKTIAIKP